MLSAGDDFFFFFFGLSSTYSYRQFQNGTPLFNSLDPPLLWRNTPGGTGMRRFKNHNNFFTESIAMQSCDVLNFW